MAYVFGDRSERTCHRLWERIPEDFRQATCFSDFWEAYRRVIPDEQHEPVGKEGGETNHVERWNLTLRQRLGRFVRKTLSFSKCDRMHEFCLRLFLHAYNLSCYPAGWTTGVVPPPERLPEAKDLELVLPCSPLGGGPLVHGVNGGREAANETGDSAVLYTERPWSRASDDPEPAVMLAQRVPGLEDDRVVRGSRACPGVPLPLNALMRLLLFLALVLAPATVAAQGARAPSGVIQGRVVSAQDGRPLPSVSVTVRSAADSSLVAGALSGPQGQVRLEGIRPGRYRVEATLLGYSPYRSDDVAVTAASPAVDLGTIQLEPSAISLEGVVAEGERSDMVVAPDRTIYSTRDMPVASGGMATDVLRSVPELEVDIEGSVSLRGTAAQIYLNGRPAPMEGESLQQFLLQFPADRIERIEVIPNPSARFEAEGAGGIVNIVLKKDVELGLSGNAFVNAGTRGDYGAGGRVTFQRGKLTLFGGSFLRLSQRDNTSYDLRQNLLADPVTFLEQNGRSERDGGMGNVDLTAEWKLSDRAMLWSQVRTFRFGNDSDGLMAYTHMDASRSPTQRYDRASTSESIRRSTDLALGFRNVLEPRRHELEVELELETGRDSDENRVRRHFFSPDGEDLGLPVELTIDDEGEDEREITLELDYVRSWGEKGQIELGYQGEVEDAETARLLAVFPNVESAEPESITDRSFAHRQRFHSLYLTMTRSLGRLGMQAGVRAERADTRLELPATGETFDNDYASIFPSANLSYDLDGGRQIRLSYSKRIRRPRSWFLNPTDRSSDPLNRQVGNPFLDPQYTHSVSLEGSWTGEVGTFRFSPYYRQTMGDWAQIKTVDEAGVSTVTWENLASVEAFGTSFTASVRPIRGIGGNASLSTYREVRDASNLSERYSGSSMRWSARGNLQARISQALSLQGMVYYTPARDVPQGRISSRIMTHFGLRQQFWGRKASVNLTLTDPFDLMQMSFETRDRTHVQIGRSNWSARSATLSFSYSFGRPPEGRRRGGEQEPQMEEPEDGIR